MKFPYQDSIKSFFSNTKKTDEKIQQQENTIVTSSSSSQSSSYNEQFQQYLERLEAYDAAEKFNKARPFLYLSLLMWPGVWLYRGMEWHNQRKHQNLQVYINKTFAQAKLIQICIITSALLAASIKKKPAKILNVNKENK